MARSFFTNMRRLHYKQSGMSSVSLLIVVIVATVTVVVMATAMPSFLRSQRAGEPAAVTVNVKASEAGVLEALRAIAEAENTFALTNSSGSFASYQQLRSGNLIDSAFNDAGVRAGYRYAVVVGRLGQAYCVTATRASRDDGDLAYTVSQQGAIYQMSGNTAPACNPDTGLITSGTILGR